MFELQSDQFWGQSFNPFRAKDQSCTDVRVKTFEPFGLATKFIFSLCPEHEQGFPCFCFFSLLLPQILLRWLWEFLIFSASEIIEKCLHDFYDKQTKSDLGLFLCKALVHWDKSWYMSSQAWPEATCTDSAQHRLLAKNYDWFFQGFGFTLLIQCNYGKQIMC